MGHIAAPWLSGPCPAESGLYYLQSRYYDPEIGRFLNADALVSTGQGVLGNNMFAYCGNNPVSKSDPSGCLWLELVAMVVTIAIILTGCSAEDTNCYAYALRLDTDPETGEERKIAADPGDFSTNAYDKTLLTYSPEVVKEDLTKMIASDAAALGYYFTEVPCIVKYTPNEGNWLIAVAYCTGPSTADYHFWRQESDNTWTHKRPNEDVRNTDFSGNVISDPASSDRGKYRLFIGYFEIGPNKGE